jgi:O-acetyl-ADP-ribose deacetylase (regulator of RNase III)
MSNSAKDRTKTGVELDRDLELLMRKKAWLIPTTPAEVQAAEDSLGRNEFELPTSLADPKSLRHRLTESEQRSEIKRKSVTEHWTHRSILLLAGQRDPVEVITERARELVLEALENGWSGPPYDPFMLAELRKIKLIASQGVVDARTTANSSGNFTTEFNPNRPRPRIRYSIAHEIAHTLFPDCAQAVRHRGFHESMSPDNWQLETLCNIAASEILMPVGSLKKEETTEVTVNVIGSFRKKYEVSSEAVLWRLTNFTDRACLAFAAHREPSSRYIIDYAIASHAWQIKVRRGLQLPRTTKAQECTAIGYTTARTPERWFSGAAEWAVEYIGIPPYPGQSFPRVLGIASPLTEPEQTLAKITVIKGSALEPRGVGNRIIVQLVNDRARTWGAGFARNARKQWPEAQERYTEWFDASRPNTRLGTFHLAEIEPSLFLASMIGQHGYGPSPKPRIRYRAIAEALEKLAELAVEKSASLHMPKIGSGESRGSWDIVREIIDEVVCRKGIPVTVYELPDSEPVLPQQPPLLF